MFDDLDKYLAEAKDIKKNLAEKKKELINLGYAYLLTIPKKYLMLCVYPLLILCALCILLISMTPVSIIYLVIGWLAISQLIRSGKILRILISIICKQSDENSGQNEEIQEENPEKSEK